MLLATTALPFLSFIYDTTIIRFPDTVLKSIFYTPNWIIDSVLESKESIREIINEFPQSELIDFVPYYNVTDKKVEYLPLEFIIASCGSNGMCAGNSPEEAIIQGICEIFERYCCLIFYRGKIKIHLQSLYPYLLNRSYFGK